AVTYRFLGEHEKALQEYQRSLSILHRLSPIDSVSLALTHSNKGIVFRDLALYDSALVNFQKGIDLLLPKADSNYHRLIIATNGLGNTSSRLGDFERSLAYFQWSERILLANFDSTYWELGVNYLNTSSLYANWGDEGESFNYLQKAEAVYEEALAPGNPSFGDLYEAMAEHYVYVGEAEKALVYLQKAMPLQNMSALESGKLLLREGEIWMEMGNTVRAERSILKARKMLADTYGEDYLETGRADRMLGRALGAQGEYPTAKAAFQRAIIAYRKHFGPRHPEMSELFLDIADLEKKHEKVLSERDVLLMAERANPIGNRNDELNLKIATAKADWYRRQFEKLPDPAMGREALWAYQVAIESLTELRRTTRRQDSKADFAARSRRIFADAVPIEFQLWESTDSLYYLEMAFGFAEQSKSIRLAESLQLRDAFSLAGIPSEIRQRERLLQQELSLSRQELQEEASQVEVDSSRLFNLQAKTFAVRRQLDRLLGEIEAQYPQYYQNRFPSTDIDLAAIQQKLREKGQSMLSFFQTDQMVWQFVLDGERIYGQKQLLPPNLESLILALARNPMSQTVSQAESLNSAGELYQLFIAPIKDQLTQSRLLIVPDGILAYVPFDILAPGDNQYLLQSHAISYTYSAAWWFNVAPRETSTARLVAMAPEYPQTELAAFDQIGSFRDMIVPLPHTQTEVEQLSQWFSGTSLFGMQASEAAFKAQAHEAGILHLSMHAMVDINDPMRSRLVFTPGADSLEDGLLHVYELINMDLRAEMAVLSACNTGRGRITSGEGVMSLSRAFAYAGCQSMLMSLWPANDAVTASLMADFYENLAQGQPKDIALQQAKLTHLQEADGIRANPYYWAAFVAVGDMAPLSRPVSNGWWWLLLAAAGTALAGFSGWRFLQAPKDNAV
ncbi:MAG: CHAT domain-containing protein, partial [Bacteroidota bacterium]